ncbi:hypothetical protein ACG7TL_009170 [Trametes sanguinea]
MADVILELVVGLAEYEKAVDSVKATPELYRKNLFETPYAHTLLAIAGTPDAPGKAIGIAMYFFNFSTWTGKPGIYLEDLYVDPTYRGTGVGKALFAELGKVAEEKDCARIDWSVLKVSNARMILHSLIVLNESPQWNQPSIDFYEKVLGATAMSEWMGMRLEGSQIQNLQKFRLASS